MLVMESDTSILLVCSLCGTRILPDQPFIQRGKMAIHSESFDCDPDKGLNPIVEKDSVR
jgi:hypothetical protein